MAEQPKYFDIEDTQTGKKYRVETDDPNATYDEAVEYFSALPETEWQQYEYNVPAPAASASAPVAAPVSQGQVSVQGRAPVENVTSNTVRTGLMGADAAATYENYEVQPLSEEDQRRYVEMTQDPSVSYEQLSKWVSDRGMSLGPEAASNLEAVRKAIAEGRPVGNEVTYKRLASEVLGDYTPDVDPTMDSDFGFALESGMAYNPMGLVTRWITDLTDGTIEGFDKETLRSQYPDLSEDQIESLHDSLIGEMRRRELINANYQVDQRDVGTVTRFLGDLIGGASPVDLIPLGRGATFGKRLAESAAENFVVDAALQAGDIAYGAQNTYDPLQGGMAAATGAALQGGLEGVARAGVKILDRTSPSAAAAPAPSGRIVVPTSRKNSKKYMAELDGAATEMVAQVNELAKGWSNAPNIEVHNNFSKLDGVSDTAIGVYTEKALDDGTKVPVVKINAEAVLARAKQRDVSPESVVEAVTFHEALGHHGLTQLFREDLDAFLDNIYTNGTEQFRDLVDDWLRKNPNSYKNYDEDSRRILATEEVMAEWSEKEGLLPKSWYDDLANRIKDFARQMGMNLKYSEREVRSYLAVAQRRVTEGNKSGATPSADRNMIVYHGSGKDFEEFDHSYMGSGEGAQRFGWGSYFTDVKDIAEGYKQRFSESKNSFDGIELPVWNLRKLALSAAESEGLNVSIAEDAFNVRTTKGKDITPSELWFETSLEYALADEGNYDPVFDLTYSELPKEWKDTLKTHTDFINSRYSTTVSGKLYEVDLPDDAKWLEWETVPLQDQTELLSALKKAGIRMIPDEQYRALVKKSARLSSEYWKSSPDKAREIQKESRQIGEILDSSVSELSEGRDAYAALSKKLGGDKEASSFLAANGFVGNRFLSNNLRQGSPRKLDGTDKFNYVVFDDKTPKIVNKYMEGDGPIDPDNLTADDLIEARNALDILNRLDYTPPVVSPDQLEAEAIARNLPPSDITRLVGMEPGKLMKRLFLYDVAATKLSDRAAKIKADIDANGLTPEKQAAYIEATMTLSDLTSRIFDFQGEIGRTLAANRRVNFSRKRVRDLKSVLEKYGAEALADPETFMKYMAEVEAKAAKKDGKAQFGTGFAQYVNIPRAIMSSADLSAPLRQGIVFIGYKEFWKSFAKMFSLLGKSGETNYNFLMKKIATDPNYELMLKARLQFSSLDGELTAREEDFQTELARKIPLYGKVVKGSEQAYAGFLNKLRADMFNRFVKEYKDAGIELDEEGLKGLGRFINAATGRAELPEFLKPSSTILNATFFSARLMHSRVQMLNPAFYAKLPAPVRKSAGKAMLRFGSIALLVNGALNALFPEVETEVDPRSSDFMKVKVGNTRFDLGGGFNQYLILGARTGTWLYNQSLGFGERMTGIDTTDYKVANKKTVGGDYRDFGAEGMTQDTYGSVLADFFRSKLSPQASYVVDFLNEEDYIGRPFTVEGSLASRLVPMTASSVYEAYAEDSPVPMPVIFTATLFGVGTNTYTAPGIDPKRELEAPLTFEMSDLEDGQNDFIRAEGGVVTLKKPARDAWTATLNNYYPLFIQEVSGEMGMQFEEMDDNMKKATVKEALKRARAAAKKDMMYELGLE